MRSLPAALAAVALLLLAGCSSPPSAAPAPGPTTGAPAPHLLPDTLAAPTRMPPVQLGAGAGEPNIAVDGNGTIYVTPVDHLYRSRDGGRSFEAVGEPGCIFPYGLGGTPCPPGKSDTIAQTDGHGDGDIAVDATGRLHWLGLFGDSGAIPYQSSDDGGATWSKGLDLSSKTGKKTDGTGSDREWLDARPEGILYASWRDSDDNGIIAARTSFDGGRTWANRTTMAPDAVGGPIVHGPVPGQVYEALTTFPSGTLPGESGGSAILLARSSDHGAHWDTVPVVVPPQSAQFGLVGFPTSIFPVAAVDGNGTVYVVFSADQRLLPQTVPKPAARYGVFLTSSSDLGLHWTQPVLLSNPDHAAVMPFIAAGAKGRAAVTWYESTAGVPSDNLPDAWNVMLWESITADTAAPKGELLQLNDLPNHIGSVCTAGTGCLAGGDRSLLDYFEVALQPNGQPIVTWASSAAGTAIGVAAQDTTIWVGGVADGTPLR